MSIAAFLVVIYAILAAAIPIFVFHIGSTDSGSGMVLFDYCKYSSKVSSRQSIANSPIRSAVNSERVYTVSTSGNLVSVEGRYD